MTCSTKFSLQLVLKMEATHWQAQHGHYSAPANEIELELLQ